PKRRACDECRGRKLACSKESDGCARCKREGIRCFYSAQKPMGRPRKRPHAEVEVAPEETPIFNLPSLPVFGSTSFDSTSFDSTIGMDLELSFLDVGNSDINFLDLLGGDFSVPIVPAIQPHTQTQILTDPAPLKDSQAVYTGGGSWHLGDHLGTIDFDVPATALPPLALAQEITLEEITHIISPDVTNCETMAVPGLTPGSGSSSSSPEAVSVDPAACSCFSRLYLAMDSLRRLPSDVDGAIRVARSAAKAAHDAVICLVCGMPPLEITNIPPIPSFQNMMMLGALLPSISNAYIRILDMVEATAQRAVDQRQKLPFNLRIYGGIWGMLLRQDIRCHAADNLEGAPLEPHMWRLTVRALLKLDVYGVNEVAPELTVDLSTNSNRQPFFQPGLKDIINMMEERSRNRHEQLDALIAEGVINPASGGCGYTALVNGKPNCLRIIDIAKTAMDDLIIP
ncbi:hypothetical protein B0T17DRAFT_473812, partial [Bombardia bombarda]